MLCCLVNVISLYLVCFVVCPIIICKGFKPVCCLIIIVLDGGLKLDMILATLVV